MFSISRDWQYSETSQLRSPSALGLCDLNSNVTTVPGDLNWEVVVLLR